MSYHNLYSMPCRLPCDRYTDPAETVEPYRHPTQKKMKIKSTQNTKMGCNCQPMVFIKEKYEYDPRTFNENYDYNPEVFNENYEYEPSISREGFVGPDCDCGSLNKPYRMVECVYNQSPSWVTQNMFDVKENYSDSGSKKSCGCGSKNPSPYLRNKCSYNQSPTWKDQSEFRDKTQNKY